MVQLRSYILVWIESLSTKYCFITEREQILVREYQIWGEDVKLDKLEPGVDFVTTTAEEGASAF